MKYPEFLKDGGCIGFVAPSFGCSTEPYYSAFRNAQKRFEQMGYRLVLGPNVYEERGIGISNTPEKCGQELTQSYLSDESDILISCGGGELMCEDLDHVDFAAFRSSRPKWYMGYSDNTNMTFLLTTLCDTASVYGPCAPAFGMEPWHPAIEDALQVLRGGKLEQKGYPLYEAESLKDEEHPLEPYHVTEARVIRSFLPEQAPDEKGTGSGMTEKVNTPVEFQGRLIGGCMDCLVNLTGTVYDRVPEFAEKYKEDGLVWFLEACDLNVMAIRRAVWQMEHAGWFRHVKGFLFGRPLHHGEELMGLDQYRAVTDLLAKYRVPVLMDLDIGHLPPMMPLVCGSMAKVSCLGQDLSIRMELK